MPGIDEFDWSSGTEDEQVRLTRRATAEQLRQIARTYDWSAYPEKVLGWIMAQKCIDLGTALSVFLNGGPERFNYIRKRDVPEDYKGAVRVLDNICLRVNSGFYLVYPDIGVTDRTRLDKWLAFQKADRRDSRRGRWILDESIVETLLQDGLRLDPERETAVYSKGRNLLRDLLSPVMDLGVSRRVLRFLPPEVRQEQENRRLWKFATRDEDRVGPASDKARGCDRRADEIGE